MRPVVATAGRCPSVDIGYSYHQPPEQCHTAQDAAAQTHEHEEGELPPQQAEKLARHSVEINILDPSRITLTSIPVIPHLIELILVE